MKNKVPAFKTVLQNIAMFCFCFAKATTINLQTVKKAVKMP